MAAQIAVTEALAAARDEQTTLVEAIRAQEEELVRFRTWEREKHRYEAVRHPPGVMVYALKSEHWSPTPPHQICATCYEDGKKSYLQTTEKTKDGRLVHVCHTCKVELAFGPLVREQRTPRIEAAYDPFNGV